MSAIRPMTAAATRRLARTGHAGGGGADSAAGGGTGVSAGGGAAGVCRSVNVSPQRAQVRRWPAVSPAEGGWRALQYGQVSGSSLMRGAVLGAGPARLFIVPPPAAAVQGAAGSRPRPPAEILRAPLALPARRRGFTLQRG